MLQLSVTGVLSLALLALSGAACQGPRLCIPGQNCPAEPPQQLLTVGGSQACWIRTDGTLWCWGDNGGGQAGLGNDPGESQPTRVGTDANWTSVSAGDEHACGIRIDGTLWCWGDNAFGEANLGEASDYITEPHLIGKGSAWAAVACGNGFTCAIRADGTLWCWGNDLQSQAGSTLTTENQSPTVIQPESTWISVAAGGFHGCAVRQDGTLWCWGDDERGQTGDGGSASAVAPIQVGSLTSWTSVTAGAAHSCALQTDGTLWCWGDNAHGQLGVAVRSKSAPVQVPLPDSARRWRAVSAGGDSTCATASDKTLWCWGSNRVGSLGLGTTADAPVPTQVGPASTWDTPALGAQNACALHVDGTISCWGFDGCGQVGDGDPQAKILPMPLTPGSMWRTLSAGDAGTCGVQGDGTLWCTGFPSILLPLDPFPSVVVDSPVFAQIGTQHDWTAVTVAYTHACAGAGDGSLWCWGDNSDGQLGSGDQLGADAPRRVGTENDWLAAPDSLASGFDFTCALKQDRSLWCWGLSELRDRLQPTQVDASRWRQICAAGSSGCGVHDDGTLWCWGGIFDASIQQIGSDADWMQVACGDGFIVALKQDGTAFQGLSSLEQISSVPKSVSISAGEDQSCGIAVDGTLWCTGGNDDGDVGDGQTNGVPIAEPIGDGHDWAMVVAGHDSDTFAVTRDGALWGWGANELAQLGLPGDVRTTPFDVSP